MSYTVIQKIRNNYYLYEVTSEWDPETKKSRQKRKYIGKCDEQGNLITNGEGPVISKDLGEYFLLFQIARDCGLWDALCEVYGIDTAKILLPYSVVRCTRRCPPTQSAYAVKNSVIPDYFGIPLDSRLLTLDGYLNQLNSVYSRRNELFKALRKGDGAMVFNSEVLREPIRFYKLYGTKSRFNFNDFPHKTEFMALDTSTNLPFFFKMANIEGVDRSSLDDVCDDLKAIGTDRVVFNLRIPGCTEYEVPTYMSSNFGTILHVDAGSPLGAEVISEHLQLVDYDTEFIDGSLYRYLRTERTFLVSRCTMYIVQDSRAHEDQALSFYRTLSSMEANISQMRWSEDLDDRLRLIYDDSPLLDLFRFSRSESGKVVVERRREDILRYDQMLGRELIITNTDHSLKDIIGMSLYAHRYDQDLSIFRTDLQGGATLFPSNETAVASLMGDFFSHVMKLSLIYRISSSPLKDEMNYLDAISIASSVKGHWANDRYSVTNIEPEQERLFRGLGMEVPDPSHRQNPMMLR